MLEEILHIGVTISDMNQSLHFYRDILGLEFIGELDMQGKETDLLFNKKDTCVRVCYLKGNDNLMSPPVELLEFKNNVNKNKADLFTTSISEICFKVKNIDLEYNRLKNLGVKFLSEPQLFDFTSYGFSKSKAVYFLDPDGIVLELIEVLD